MNIKEELTKLPYDDVMEIIKEELTKLPYDDVMEIIKDYKKSYKDKEKKKKQLIEKDFVSVYEHTLWIEDDEIAYEAEELGKKISLKDFNRDYKNDIDKSYNSINDINDDEDIDGLYSRRHSLKEVDPEIEKLLRIDVLNCCKLQIKVDQKRIDAKKDEVKRLFKNELRLEKFKKLDVE